MFRVNNKHILTYFTSCSGVLVDFEQVTAGWENNPTKI